jgi:hypothetical protein
MELEIKRLIRFESLILQPTSQRIFASWNLPTAAVTIGSTDTTSRPRTRLAVHLFSEDVPRIKMYSIAFILAWMLVQGISRRRVS